MPNNDQPEQDFAWCAHPARERLGLTVVALGLIAGFGLLTAVMMGSPLWGVFAGVTLLAVLNRYFFASRFVIDDDGLTAKHPLRRQRVAWADLKRFVHDERGGFLSTYARRTWRDGHRGVQVLFGGQREIVLPRINAHLPDGANTWGH